MKKKSGRGRGPRKPPNGPDEVFPHAFSSCVIKFRCKYEIHSPARRCFGEALCSCLHLHQASNVGLPMCDLVSPSPNFARSFDYKQLSSKQPNNLLNTTNQNQSQLKMTRQRILTVLKQMSELWLGCQALNVSQAASVAQGSPVKCDALLSPPSECAAKVATSFHMCNFAEWTQQTELM